MKYEDGFLILTDAEVELLACSARANVEPILSTTIVVSILLCPRKLPAP